MRVIFLFAVTGLLFFNWVYPGVEKAASKFNAVHEITRDGLVAISRHMSKVEGVGIRDFSEHQNSVVRRVYFLPIVLWNYSADSAECSGMQFLTLPRQQENESFV